MNSSLDIELYRTWIGREEQRADIVTPELVRRFRATCDLAMDEPSIGDAAPLGIHWCLAPPAYPTGALGPDGHPERGGFLPPVPLPRRMWAGGKLALAQPIRIGDEVQRTSRIEDVVLKEGRTGPLCFVTVRHVLSVGEAVVVDERQDIVYREVEAKPPTAAGKSPSEPAPQARWSKSVDASEVRLFRYSALTFNGHRIHYDRRFCESQEGYPGLVVHGPLQATLLLLFATEIRKGAPPANFAFRSAAPLFDGAAFQLNAVEAADGLRLWTAGANGRAAMSAEADE